MCSPGVQTLYNGQTPPGIFPHGIEAAVGARDHTDTSKVQVQVALVLGLGSTQLVGHKMLWVS